MGAVTAAIVAGNAPEDHVPQLRRFWSEATQHTAPSVSGMLKPRQVYNGLHAVLTLMWGRPNIFQHRWPGLWSALPGAPNDVAMFDHAPLLASINRYVDFERLNRGDIRVTIGCVDVASGEEVYFDTARGMVRAEHVLASTSLLPAFPPVEIDGRLLCDLGYTNNLPLDPIFADEPKRDLLCIASDLFNLQAPRPGSLDAVLETGQRPHLRQRGPTGDLGLEARVRTATAIGAERPDRDLAAYRLQGGRRSALGEELRLLAVLDPGSMDGGKAGHGAWPGRPDRPPTGGPTLRLRGRLKRCVRPWGAGSVSVCGRASRQPGKASALPTATIAGVAPA